MKRVLHTYTVEELCEQLIDYRGKTPTKTESGVPLITAKVIKEGRILDTGLEYIAEAQYDEWMRRGLPLKGDVLVTTEAPLGEVAAIKTDDRIALAQRVILLRANPSICDPSYLLYAFRSSAVQAELDARASGCIVRGIKNSELRKVKVTLPSLKVQQRIADTLTAYDDLMENNRRRMTLLEESARLLYQEWFVHLRFPGHEHTRLVDGVPQDWGRVPLGEVMTLQRGHDLPSQERVEGDIPIVSSSGITGFHDKKKADAPGVVTGRYGTLGQVYYVDRDYWPLNTALYVADFKSSPPLFVLHLLKHALESIQSDKAAIPGLNRNVVHSMKVLCPPKSLRDSFGNFAEPIYDQISTLTQQNDKLRAARDLLLPRLMSGEIAV
jgi:type I restriction enzyme S subunit